VKYTPGRTFALLALAVVLASIGAAAAMWSETLMVNVYVSTGEVDVKWSDYYCSDTGSDPQIPDGFSNEEGKDVASCTVEEELYDEENDLIKLRVTLNNTYPGYAVNITLIVDNIGTIPVKLNSSSISEYDNDVLAVRLIPPSDTQIEPGDNATYILEVRVLQGAEENASYSFEVTLVFAQWNEVQ